MAKTLDLTNGPIARKLLLFALPLLGASLIQQLYTTVDILFVSNYLGTGASAAVGASVLLNSALVNLFTGISIGAGVVIAQAFGRKEEVQLSKSIHTSMMLGLIGGVLLTIIGEFSGSAFLNAVKTPASIFQDALDYVQVFFLGLTFMLVFNMAAGAAGVRYYSCSDEFPVYQIYVQRDFGGSLVIGSVPGAFGDYCCVLPAP